MSTSPLFQPFSCRGMTIANRIVMAPMTRSFSPDGIPGNDVATYYERRAAADVGLIVTEGTTVDRAGASNDPRVPVFHGEAALAGWKNVVDKVHAAGGVIAPQLWHQGMMRKPGTGVNPEAASDGPSGITHKGKKVQEAPSDSEIADMVMAYVSAASDAKRLGFDCVEIHGAHGYLIDEFFWGVMNIREDKYGGDLVERARFAGEGISETRKLIGDDMPIILRWSQWKQQDYGARLAQTPQELEAFLGVFVDAGVDIIHCSQRRYQEAEFPEVDGEKGLNLAGWAKKLTGKPTICRLVTLPHCLASGAAGALRCHCRRSCLGPDVRSYFATVMRRFESTRSSSSKLELRMSHRVRRIRIQMTPPT